jgi:hypothetical protein
LCQFLVAARKRFFNIFFDSNDFFVQSCVVLFEGCKTLIFGR